MGVPTYFFAYSIETILHNKSKNLRNLRKGPNPRKLCLFYDFFGSDTLRMNNENVLKFGPCGPSYSRLRII